MIKGIQEAGLENANGIRGIRGIRASEAKEISTEKDNGTNLLGKTATKESLADYANAIKANANQANGVDKKAQEKADKFFKELIINKGMSASQLAEKIMEKGIRYGYTDPRKCGEINKTLERSYTTTDNKTIKVTYQVHIYLETFDDGVEYACLDVKETSEGGGTGGKSATSLFMPVDEIL